MRVHNHRRTSRQKYTIIFKSFVTDITATKAAEIAGVNRKTADRYYNLFRIVILRKAIYERKEANLGNGVEVDESYFGPKRIRGKRGRGAGRKIVVFGLLKIKGKVYTQVVRSAEKKELMPIIRRVVQSGSDIYTDGWRSYNALAVYGYNHKKVKHGDNEFAKKDGAHINGIESFWSWTKRRLNKFNGIGKRHFQLYLLECEWRFNHMGNISKDLRKLLRNF